MIKLGAEGYIVQSNMIEEVHKLEVEGNLFDFLPHIDTRWHPERVILQKWVDFFKRKSVPFAVIKYANGNVKMFKEKAT